MILTKGDIALSVVCVLAGTLLGAGFRSCSKPTEPTTQPETIHDTVTVRDTLHIKEHTKPKEVVRRDTIWLPLDTPLGTSLDTGSLIPVDLPITRSEYRDTFTTDSSRIELGVKFSGWHAQIDAVDLNYDFTIPTKIVTKRQRFSWSLTIGLQGGYGATFGKDGVVEMRPYAGVGGTLGASINF